MNKLELEMRERCLGYDKEICEFKVKVSKRLLLASRMVLAFSVFAIVWLTLYCKDYIKMGDLTFIAIYILCFVTDAVVFLSNVSSIKSTKRQLEHEEQELERVNSDIKALKEYKLNAGV